VASSKLNVASDWFFFWNWDYRYPDATLLGSSNSIEVNDVLQGKLGTCYFMASLAAVASKPSYINTSLLTNIKNHAGIYGFKFFIRGKPWVVTIDSSVLFENPT
jgi:hypothetical protein